LPLLGPLFGTVLLGSDFYHRTSKVPNERPFPFYSPFSLFYRYSYSPPFPRSSIPSLSSLSGAIAPSLRGDSFPSRFRHPVSELRSASHTDRLVLPDQTLSFLAFIHASDPSPFRTLPPLLFAIRRPSFFWKCSFAILSLPSLRGLPLSNHSPSVGCSRSIWC